MSISGLVLHVSPERTQFLRSELELMDGVDVHMSTEDGRMIVTLDVASDEKASDAFTEFQNMDGVLSASLAYSYFGEDTREETQMEDVL